MTREHWEKSIRGKGDSWTREEGTCVCSIRVGQEVWGDRSRAGTEPFREEHALPG